MRNWQKWLIVVGIMALVIGVGMAIQRKKEVVVQKPVEEVKIAIMADVHNDTDSLGKALRQASSEGDSMVVIAGDLTIDGTKAEEDKVKTSLDNGGMTYYIVPGNHDDYKNIWEFGKRYQTLMVGEMKLILVDNSNWRGLGALQWQWLPEAVSGCKTMVCLAVMHMPLNNNWSGHIMGEYSPEVATEAAKLLGLLRDSGVRRIEAGHLHMATSYELDGVWTDIVGAISKDRNTETPRFTQLTVTGDKIETKVVEIE